MRAIKLATWRGRAPWLLGALALVVALASPDGVAGGLASMMVVALLGCVVVESWQRLPTTVRQPPELVRHTLVLAIVVSVGAFLCGNALLPGAGWLRGDWGPQHAILRQLIDAPSLPHWNNAISTGESPFETYPAMTYELAAGLANILGWQQHPLDALLLLGVLTHIAIALGIARLALRVAPAWVAAFIGVLALVDRGALSAGGLSGIFEWGILHSAVAQAFTLMAAVAVVDALRRPTLGTAVTIWVFTSLAAVTHPSALIAVLALIVGLGAVAVLARDVPARWPLLAAGHLVLGLLLAAGVWMPLGERLLLYGQHFSNLPRTSDGLLGELVTSGFPWSSVPMVIMAGTLGLLVGLWSRRAVPVLIGATGVVLLVLSTDAAYLLFDLAPSLVVARLGTTRLMALLRPMAFVGAAVLAAELLRVMAARWQGTTPRQRRPAIMVAAVLALLAVRALLPWWDGARATVTASTHRTTSGDGEAELTAWAQAQVAATPPGVMARALFEIGDEHYNYHLTATTGLPTLHLGATAAMLLRERIPDGSDASLRRFNVRWIVGADQPPTLGDPASERRIGRFYLREVVGWDGAFARLERGGSPTATITTTAITSDHIDVSLTGTEPALVALGTGFYPRFRVAPSGPVYACPTTPTSTLRVPCAWLSPGTTRFVMNGALPSDHHGLPLAVAALAIAIAIVVVGSRRRWRYAMLRRWARARAWLRPRHPLLHLGGIAGLGMVLILGSVRACIHDATHLQVGTGLRSAASIEVLVDGAWQVCGYSAVRGRVTCPGGVDLVDGTDALLNDEQPGWPFTTPAIRLYAPTTVDVRIAWDLTIGGRYLAASRATAFTLAVDDDLPFTLGAQQVIDLGSATRHRVVVTGRITGTASLTMVAESTLLPPREFLRDPPAAPPR